MKDKKHIVIFSHGFGVRKDDLGLLSSIAESIPEVESILFDYFDVDEENKTITTCTISEQVKKLDKIIKETKNSNPGVIIDLICHSQGTVVSALACPLGIRKTIMLAPVFEMGLERTLTRYKNNPNAYINLEGVSKLPILDGYLRIVPKEYWAERVKIQPFIEFNKFSEKTEMIVIKAKQDEILKDISLEELNSKIQAIELDGDHNFNGEARKPLIEKIREYIL